MRSKILAIMAVVMFLLTTIAMLLPIYAIEGKFDLEQKIILSMFGVLGYTGSFLYMWASRGKEIE